MRNENRLTLVNASPNLGLILSKALRGLGKILRALSLLLLGALVLVIVVLAASNVRVLWVGNRSVLHDPTLLPRSATGLVLGTSPRSHGAEANPFFEGRMDAAARLYHEGVLARLLLSGDNRRADYNEPGAMREALLARGIPSAAITLDYAGFRTLDSVIRAQKVFHTENTLIITDDFHLPRALFIAAEIGLPAVGFASAHVPLRRSLRTRLREILSRTRACLDVYVWKTQPRFLGAPVPLSRDPVDAANPQRSMLRESAED